MALPRLLDRGRGRGLALVAALTVAQGIAAGAAAFATRALFEALHRGAAPPVAGLGVLVAAGAVIAGARIAARHVGERIGQDYARQIRAALFERAALMPASAVAERRAGYLALRFVGDMTAFRNWLGVGLPRLVAGAVLIPATLAVLWLLDPAFAPAVLPVLVLTALAIGLGGMRLVPAHRRLRARRARIAADMAERMPLAPRLDRLGRRGLELARLHRRSDAMIAAALRHRLLSESLRALPDLSAGIAAALVILAGARAGIAPAGIAGALAAVGLLLGPLRDLGGVWNHRAAFRVAAGKAEAVLARAERGLYRAGRSLAKAPVAVVFDDVALPSGERLSCAVSGRRRVALALSDLDVDPVLDMLQGLEAPASGRILLSGIDLRDLSRGSLRRGVLRIGPAPEILQGSLRRVLVMGASDRPEDAELERLAREEGLGDLLDRLGGLDGTVHEGGRNFTRRERIGVSLVRMRLLRPRLLLIDAQTDAFARARVRAYRTTRAATVIEVAPPAVAA